MNIESQKDYYSKHIRSESGHAVVFNNFLAPHPRDVNRILFAFVSKLHHLIQQVETDFDALIVAAWAKRRLTEVQPAIDGNTRAGRAIHDVVLAQIAARKPHLNIYRVNLTSASVATDVIEYQIDGRTYAFSPFSSDLKDDLNTEIFEELDQFASSTNRRYYFVDRGVEITPVPSSSFVDIVGPMVLWFVRPEFEGMPEYQGNAPHWDTLRDFLLGRMSATTLATLRNNPKLAAEANRIIEMITQYGYR